MPSRILIITAVRAEAEAITPLDGVRVVAGGVGRTNAACATVETVLREGPFDLVLSAGVAGALPGGPPIGTALLASRCVYAEEGLVTAGGFRTMQAMGFALGDFFDGNAVAADRDLVSRLEGRLPAGVVATVATCSGTDAAAREVARRTGAVAEAMEGAAVVHAARRLGVRAGELRAISNTTGDRARQEWDLEGALRALGEAVRRVVEVW